MEKSFPSFVRRNVEVTVPCEVCGREVGLVCQRMIGPAAYPVWVEFGCPHCRRLNRLKAPGPILSVSKAAERAVAAQA